MIKKITRQQLLEKLGNQFKDYKFDLREKDFREELFILSESHEDFKTTIVLDEFPITEEQAESVCGVLDGIIQLLKYHKRI